MSSKDLLSSYINIFKAINQHISYARLKLCCKARKVTVYLNHDLRVIPRHKKMIDSDVLEKNINTPCVFAHLHIWLFSVWPLPEVENLFRKQIWNENVYITILKKNCGASRSVFKKVKKWISHCSFKSCAEGFWGLFSC